VASGINGVALAWITAVPSDTPVTGTVAVVAPVAKVAVAGTVATPGVSELKFTVNPPDGAEAERLSDTFCVAIPVIVTVGWAKVTVAVPFTVPVPEV
jgi:hypothetical protein